MCGLCNPLTVQHKIIEIKIELNCCLPCVPVWGPDVSLSLSLRTQYILLVLYTVCFPTGSRWFHFQFPRAAHALSVYFTPYILVFLRALLAFLLIFPCIICEFPRSFPRSLHSVFPQRVLQFNTVCSLCVSLWFACGLPPTFPVHRLWVPWCIP